MKPNRDTQEASGRQSCVGERTVSDSALTLLSLTEILNKLIQHMRLADGEERVDGVRDGLRRRNQESLLTSRSQGMSGWTARMCRQWYGLRHFATCSHLFQLAGMRVQKTLTSSSSSSILVAYDTSTVWVTQISWRSGIFVLQRLALACKKVE